MNEKKLRLIVFAVVAALHVLAILFFAITTERAIFFQEADEDARIMRLADLQEEPPPPPEPEPELPIVEAIAEIMIESDDPPPQHVLDAGVFLDYDFLPMHLVSVPPQFDTSAIAADLVFPPIALRAGIEGRVILELFVDRNGYVQRIVILQENPPGRGFGEAAVRAFTGRRGTPAMANGEPVAARYRWPVTFRIR